MSTNATDAKYSLAQFFKNWKKNPQSADTDNEYEWTRRVGRKW